MPLAFLARRALAALAVLLAAPAVLAQTGAVVGTVTDTDGEPLAAATVRIDNTTLGDATDVDGMFRVAGVPAGSQTVVITLLGYTRVEREVTVPAGGDVRVDATLADDALRLSEVAVTATRRTEDISDVPRAVAVATEETVDRYAEQTSDFSATLGKFIPNFTSPSVGNDVFTATLRGRKPLYLLDGVPLQTNEGVRGATLSNIEPSVLDRIEVLYGASTVYGGGAPGGVIQFFTREASEEPLDVQVQGFTRNYLLEDRILDGDALDFRTSATVSGTLDRFRYLVNGALETANGTFRADGQRIGNVGTNDYDEYALFGKFSYDLTPSQTVRVTVNRDYRQPNNLFFTNQVLDEDRLADPVLFTSVSVPVETAFSYDTPISQTYTSGNVQYQNRALGGGALSLQGYYFDTNFQQGGSDIRELIASNPSFAAWPGLWQTSSDAEQIGARIEYVRPITDQVLVTVGGDVLSASDATPVTVSTEGPFDAENRFDGAGGVQDQGAPTDLVS
ncbi:MAG: carboxypeptidase-like regulatory domain-containing protein, partial [Bacteroidota bacterium]